MAFYKVETVAVTFSEYCIFHLNSQSSATCLEPGVEFLPQLVLCSGFFLIYLVEEAVEAVLGGSGHAEAIHRHVSVR